MAKIRFFNACSDKDLFDIYYQGKPFCTNIGYKDCSKYYDIAYGQQMFKLCKPKKIYSIVDGYTYIRENSYQTAIITGRGGDLGFYIVPDAYFPVSYNKAFIRFVNLDPASPDLDFTFSDTSFVIFRDIGYRDATKYYPVNADTYTIRVRLSNTHQNILTIRNVELKPNRFYTIYVLGHYRDGTTQYMVLSDGID